MKATYQYSARYATAGILLLFLSMTAVAQTNNSASLKYLAAQEDLTVAQATVQAYETGDWDELRSHLSPEAKIYGLGNTDTLTVDETLTYWSRGRDDATPTLSENGTWLTVSMEEGPRKGNWVMYWGTNTLTYRNGEDISFPFHVSMKMEDNQVIEAHFYYDNMKIIRSLGYAISPPLEEEEKEESDPEERF